jgi:hypothetical protein
MESRLRKMVVGSAVAAVTCSAFLLGPSDAATGATPVGVYYSYGFSAAPDSAVSKTLVSRKGRLAFKPVLRVSSSYEVEQIDVSNTGRLAVCEAVKGSRKPCRVRVSDKSGKFRVVAGHPNIAGTRKIAVSTDGSAIGWVDRGFNPSGQYEVSITALDLSSGAAQTLDTAAILRLTGLTNAPQELFLWFRGGLEGTALHYGSSLMIPVSQAKRVGVILLTPTAPARYVEIPQLVPQPFGPSGLLEILSFGHRTVAITASPTKQDAVVFFTPQGAADEPLDFQLLAVMPDGQLKDLGKFGVHATTSAAGLDADTVLVVAWDERPPTDVDAPSSYNVCLTKVTISSSARSAPVCFVTREFPSFLEAIRSGPSQFLLTHGNSGAPRVLGVLDSSKMTMR